MTTPAPAPQPKRGRPPIPPEQRLLLGGLRLTQEQWTQFEGLGGVEWLRATIKRAAARKQKS